MNKEMIISSNGHETRVAILEDDLVAEIFVERERNRGVVGNVYKGRVSKVLPGMQSAFVDIGLERDGFLYVSDVISPADLFDDDDEDEDSAIKSGDRRAMSRQPRSDEGRRSGRGRRDERGGGGGRSDRSDGRDVAEDGSGVRKERPAAPTQDARIEDL